MPQNNNDLIVLSSMSVGQKGLVVAFSIETKEGERIEEMGLSPGEQLEVVRLLPSEDSLEIRIRGYFVSLTKKEADHIKVKPLS